MDTAIVEREVATLPEEATDEQLANAILKVETLLNIGKAMKSHLETVLLARLQKTKGVFVMGDMLYVVGKKKDTVCRNLGETLLLCWEMTPKCKTEAERWKLFGEMFLCSGPVKHGAFKKNAGEDAFAAHFDVIETPKLDKEGKPALSVINTKFLNQGS